MTLKREERVILLNYRQHEKNNIQLGDIIIQYLKCLFGKIKCLNQLRIR